MTVQNWGGRIIEARQVTLFHKAFQPRWFPKVKTGEWIPSTWWSKASRGNVDILVGNTGEIRWQLSTWYACKASMHFRFQEIAFSAPYFLFLLPPPTLWPPRRHIYSVKKVERRRHWRLIFFICTEHFLQLFWTSSKHLNLFFRIWLMLENIVSRWKLWSDLVNLNLFANSIRKHAPPPPPCAYMHAQSCDWRAWWELFELAQSLLW